jgi:membrane protease YdiL (CAAX protease family)
MDAALLIPPPTAGLSPALPVRRRAAKPRIWTPFAALLVAVVGGIVLMQLAYGIVLGFVHARGVAEGLDAAQIEEQYLALVDGTFLGFVIGFLAIQLPMGLVVLLAAWSSKEPFKQRLGLQAPEMPRYGWVAAPFAALGDLTMTGILSFVIVMLMGIETPDLPPDVVNPTLAVSIAMAALTALVPAVFEELLFRGYIQRRLLQRWSPAVAIGVQGVLFALLHFDTLQHVLAVLPGGIFYGILAYRTRSIWPGVLLHFLNNAYVAGLGPLESAAAESAAAAYISVAMLAVAVFLGAPSILYLLFGRIRRADSVALDVERFDEAGIDASRLPQPLVTVAAPDSASRLDAAPLTSLSA